MSKARHSIRSKQSKATSAYKTGGNGPDDSMAFSASGATDFFRRTSVKNPRQSMKSMKSKKSGATAGLDDSLAFSASQATDYFNRSRSLAKTTGPVAMRKSSLKRSSNVSNGGRGSFKR